MIILDRKRKKRYENVNKTQAAEIVGVDRKTIYNWSRQRAEEIYNDFEIYFDTIKLKSGVKVG